MGWEHVVVSRVFNSFSALQRAENSSIEPDDQRQCGLHLFQCSSASRKFLNCALPRSRFRTSVGFSALQRAENSSITRFAHLIRAPSACFSALQRAENSSIRDRQQLLPAQSPTFQCSSASRKFLNADPRTCVHPYFRPR